MRYLIFLTLFLASLATFGQVSDATGTATAESIRTATTAGSNTAAIVGGNIKNLWLSKGNKQEANTWTEMQTFTGSATRGGLRFGNYTANPSTPQAGETYYNTTTGYFAGYQGAWRYFLMGDAAAAATGAVPYSTAVNRFTTDADMTFTGGNQLNVTKFLGGAGTAITSANASTIVYAGSAASGNIIAQAVNVRQSVASTGVHFGDYVKAYADHTSGTVNQLLAIQGNAENNNAGTVTNARGVLGGTLTTNGPITNAIGVKAEGVFIAGSGTVTNSYGLHVSGATVGSGTVTNDYGVYQSGSGVTNVFEGTTQINQIPLSAAGVLHYGTYTPTITAIANIDATTAFSCTYTRVGNMVTIIGQIDADATAAGSTTTRVRLSLPVSSNFANANEAGGAGNRPGSNPGDVGAYADSTNDEVILHWLSTGTGNQTITFMFGYRVI